MVTQDLAAVCGGARVCQLSTTCRERERKRVCERTSLLDLFLVCLVAEVLESEDGIVVLVLPPLRVEFEQVLVLVLAPEVGVDVVLDLVAVAEGGEALSLELVVLLERAVVQDAAGVGVEGGSDGVDCGARRGRSCRQVSIQSACVKMRTSGGEGELTREGSERGRNVALGEGRERSVERDDRSVDHLAQAYAQSE